MKPKYYVRSDDYMVFSLNADGETYSIEKFKVEHPAHLHHHYPESVLVRNGFFVGREDDFPEYAKKQAAFYEKMAEDSRQHSGMDDDDD